MDNYLVTGGAGFIGSNIVEELVKRGEKVRVLDNLCTGKEENLKPFSGKIEFYKGDIRKAEDVEKALKGITYVIHQAALRSVARSVEEPWETNDVNVSGTLNVLMRAKEANVKRVVYASSSSAYGDCAEYPQKETFEPKPISPYAVSKLAAEHYCRMFSATLSLETVSLRYFNVFGPRQNPESKYSAVIPAFIAMLIKNIPCTIDGDGLQSRDFTYVGNVVDANLAACKATGASGLAINVACGADYSVVDVAENLKKILGKNINSVHGPKRNGDVRKTYADITRLKTILKIEPKVNFHDGLKKTVEWFLKNPGIVK
ncbi:nucleoside-diphosphate-sugar epimerase [Candidatus Omnitrophus magneticus]|uniref:Nucleoside-diphosphate-sugar epimerase n=1 Tax=Candidatus Omnitrophus magneticus TaxID=1609969 RepID=A0A0F0CPQ5_9BACT|nr:nucleoside-diphosphate-sugar epimerase [Candidatus Omnitrophus magneticus]